MPILRPLLLFALAILLGLLIWKGFLVVAGLFGLDARARWREYRRYRDTGCPKLRAKLMTSWCGRGVLAAAEPNWSDPRPLHLLPDGSPWVFFKRRFWVSALGLSKERSYGPSAPRP